MEHVPLLLLLLKGHPGTGKSTLARIIAQRLHWPLIDKDDARDCFCGLESSAPECDWNALSYKVMFRYAQTQLSLGLSTIIDCPFARSELYDEATAIAQQAHATVVLLECQPSDTAAWKQRLEARALLQQQAHGNESLHKPQRWEDMQLLLDRYQGCWQWSTNGRVEVKHHLILDTTFDNPDQNADRVLTFLRDVLKLRHAA